TLALLAPLSGCSRLPSIDQRFDALLLRIGRSCTLCLRRLRRGASKVASRGFDASLCQISVNSLRKPLGDLLENLHRFSALLLTLQASTIRIELWCGRNFDGM